jgi:hypothetical protein
MRLHLQEVLIKETREETVYRCNRNKHIKLKFICSHDATDYPELESLDP